MARQTRYAQPITPELRAGILNMLCNCAGLRPGQSLLILCEHEDSTQYDPGLTHAVATVAKQFGARVTVRALLHSATATRLAPEVLKALGQSDHALFLTRRGDQLRFDPSLAHTAPVMCYALDRRMMASAFGRADHRGFKALLACLNTALAQARHVHVTCPLGTDFHGPGARFPKTGGEVSVRRFPLSVFSPVPAAGYRGTIAVEGFLTGTGKSHYTPYDLPLSDVLHVQFNGTRITGFRGPDAPAARAHYAHVGATLGTTPRHVHSWHAGIHPGCAYDLPAAANIERWGSGAFGNPRVLHFHTCGQTAPGEISLNVIDPTIRLDGVAVWEAGRLYPERISGGADILDRHDGMAALFAQPETAIGLDLSGHLSAWINAPATG